MHETASLLNRPQSAALLAVSLRTFDERVANGEIPCVKIGRSSRFRRVSLEAYIEACETRLSPSRRK